MAAVGRGVKGWPCAGRHRGQRGSARKTALLFACTRPVASLRPACNAGETGRPCCHPNAKTLVAQTGGKVFCLWLCSYRTTAISFGSGPAAQPQDGTEAGRGKRRIALLKHMTLAAPRLQVLHTMRRWDRHRSQTPAAFRCRSCGWESLPSHHLFRRYCLTGPRDSRIRLMAVLTAPHPRILVGSTGAALLGAFAPA